MAEAFKCAICLEPAHTPVVTRCGHLFCWSCLDAWATQRQRRTVPCPVCCGACDIDNETTPIYGAGVAEGAAPPQHPSQHRRAGAGAAAAAGAGAGAGGEEYQQHNNHHQEQQHHAPPPQAHRRNDPAPPPANQHHAFGFGGGGPGGFLAPGGLGFAGIPLMFIGGIGGNFFESIIFSVLIGLAVTYFLRQAAGEGQQQQQQQNNQQQQGGGGIGNNIQRNLRRLRDEAVAVGRSVGNFLWDYATPIMWVVAILVLLSASEWPRWFSLLFSDAPPSAHHHRQQQQQHQQQRTQQQHYSSSPLYFFL